MNKNGFTLIEIAIVLVIIGLLLGGVLKGQELINSAKVKNFAQDFRTTPILIYGYQDKYRALPGDDSNVVTHVGGTKASTSTQTQGNATIEGNYNSTTTTDESVLFWQHVRLANLAAGPTDTTDSNYFPTNADGGRVGLQSTTPISAMTGSYFVCSDGILGKYVKQLDTTLDDGGTSSGSMRAAAGTYSGTALTATATTSISDSTTYVVCLAI